jgi:hypothetical protein
MVRDHLQGQYEAADRERLARLARVSAASSPERRHPGFGIGASAGTFARRLGRRAFST